VAVGDGVEPSNPFLDQTVFKTVPLANTVVPPYSYGAGERNRTPDILITNQALYRLSYSSDVGAPGGIRTHRIQILSLTRMPVPSPGPGAG
jgi:hypothetical protein